MQNEPNTYAAPNTRSAGASASGEVSAGILQKLSKTRPWVMLIAILLFIGAAFMVFGAIAITAVGTFGAQEAGLPPFMGIGLAAGYLIGAVLYLFLGIYLIRYSGAIKRSALSGSSTDVEQAIGHQHAFWRLAGILALIAIAFMVVAFVVWIVGGIAGGLMAP